MKKSFLFFAAVCCMMMLSNDIFAKRSEKLLTDWKFSHADKDGQAEAGFDDHAWEDVCVPHDWAISGPFDNNLDKQTVAIVQNGENVATEKTGRTGSLPWVGIGWYRTHFKVGKKSGRVVLNFDGAMSEPQVFVNGKKAGEWKYGYNAFNIDITQYVNRGKDNVVAVRLENLPESSRWYPGAGLYRPVTLIETGSTAIADWGINFVTKSIDGGHAAGEFSIDIIGGEGKPLMAIVEMRHKGAKGNSKVMNAEADVVDGKAKGWFNIPSPHLWTPETPELYELTVRLYEIDDKGKYCLIDRKQRNVGIRTVEINKEKGFALNGVTRKIKGVCLHHDLGMFGSAVNRPAIIRQIMMLKSMGCDAIRTAHNMPSQMQMDLCDSLGMMVMAESFDMWEYPKCKNGYGRYYKEWWQRDLTNLVMANRLHPSIVMWSIGNEIPEQGSQKGAQMCKEMQDFMHLLDPSRLCTTGMDRWDACVKSGFAAIIDVPGMNYRTHRYQFAHDNLPQGFVLGSETASTVSSRGTYYFPAEQANNKTHPDAQCSGYDLEACSWSNLPEEDWELQDDNDWVIGEFVWTGFDYLGEPTPYDGAWPSRSSYFGIIDLAGLPKDRYYLYRARWNKDEHTIHLLPHWTWQGREGMVTPVYCYTDYPSAELFVNGKSQGKRTKDVTLKGGHGNPAIDRYRLRWNEVKYEPGELKVVVYDSQGRKSGEKIVRTAGKADHLKTESQTYEDFTFVTVSVVDENGVICPEADNQLTFEVENGRFRGVCNGDATSTEVFTKPTMKTFKGQLVFCVEGKNAKVTISSPNLPKNKTLYPSGNNY